MSSGFEDETHSQEQPGNNTKENAFPATSDAVANRSTTTSVPKKEEKVEVDDDDALPEIKEEKTKAEIEEEKKKKKEAANDPSSMVTFSELFRFASGKEKLLIFLASLASAGNGLALPLFAVVFGDLMNNFGLTESEILDKVLQNTNYFLIIGACSFVFSWAGLGLWIYSGETRTKRLREEYLRSILRQDMSYFDLRKPGEIPSQLISDSTEYQNGTGEKVSNAIQHTVTFWAGIIVGFVKGWQLALVVLGVTPLMGVTITIFTVVMGKWSKTGQDAYASAGAIADEALSAVRTVNAFNAQEVELKRYSSHLDVARISGIKSSVGNGSAMGLINLVVFSAYGLCLWFGAYLVRERVTNARTGDPYSPGDVISVFFAIIMGAMSLGQIGPAFQALALARSAARRMYDVIDTKPKIDSLSAAGERPAALLGDVVFDNVSFSYPSRKEAPVFSGFNLHVKPGQTVAFVGASGSGKSTIVALLQRFYDPDQGVIRVDGRELTKLNIGWWRDHVGVVSQEPVLFSGTVKENIAYGREGITEQQIVDAAKAANAHNFIMDMKDGYNSQVGEDGSLLSGGQKQRVAIARAILKNPKVLLLDEATSALDNESERLVQQALNNMMVDRTTLIVAHRLSTIINSDAIFVLENGKIIESGKHEELMARDGVYANLLRAQQTSQEEKDQMAVGAKKEGTSVAISVEQKKERLRSKSHAGLPKDTAAEVKKNPPVPNSRVFEVVSDMWPLILLGSIAAAASGVAFPLWSIIFGDMMQNLFISDEDTQKERSEIYAVYFFLLGLGLFITEISKSTAFGFVGERLTVRLREKSFKHIFRQEVGFFDEPDNNPRALASRLALDAGKVQSGTTNRLGVVFQIIANLVTGLVIAFVNSWALALVVLSLAPVMVIASVFQMKFVMGFQTEGKGAFEKAGEIVSESVANIRTVASFRAENFIYNRFSAQLQESVRVGTKIASTSGIALGFSQMVIFFAYALYFWYGAKLVADGDITFGDMMKVIFSIVIAAMGIGQTSQMAADVGKGIEGRDNIFALLDRKSKIDSDSPDGDKSSLPNGAISFENVQYRYVNRPEVPVLRGLNLNLKPGQTLALVGPSGSGKSTIVSLLLRFYDPESGRIVIDGHDIKTMNVKHLRAQIGVVSQEPRLIDGTIADNIKYGKADSTMEEVMEAAKQANIHDAIMKFPLKYDTPVGVRGNKLSGGQKQRVAIARALIKKPRILLFDEATSALDAKSEKIVQQAIERLMASRERTTILIAHRLSTVKNADVITVLEKGAVVEQGNHKELMDLNGVYTALYRAGEKRQ